MSQKKLSFLASIFSFSGIYDISAPDPDPIINLVPRKKIKGKFRFVQVRKDPKIGRNQLCPCGSNRKYKHCCIEK